MGAVSSLSALLSSGPIGWLKGACDLLKIDLPIFNELEGFLAGLVGFGKTHFPDDDELPDGTWWLNGDHGTGVIEVFRDRSSDIINWRGEILASKETNFPIARWNYASQEFFPLAALTRQGLCVFASPHEYPDGMAHYQQSLVPVIYDLEGQPSAEARGECVSRSISWVQLVDQHKRWAIEAASRGCPGGANLIDKIRNKYWYSTPEPYIGAGLLGGVSTVATIAVKRIL